MNRWDDEDWATTEAMIRMGGGFVSKLGELYRQGDGSNQAKLRAAFPKYFEEYGQLAKMLEKKERAEG